jgi:hypothetical protein
MSLLDSASLICTPNAVKEGKLYSVIPSDGSGDMSVVRATTATRVNSAGLVELVPYNLLTWSEDFTNAAWTKQSSTITSNATTAPNGTLTADKIIETAVNDAHLTVQSKSISASVITASVFLKKSELQYAVVFISNTINKNFAVLFDVNNGTVVTNFTSIPSYAAPTSSSIEDMGNGWYRCTVTATDSFTNADLVIALNKSGTDSGFSYVGDGTSGLFLWGAQLVEGSTALPYQKTETRLNIPRLDYSNGTCPSLLVEPQRTNVALYSSSFDNAVWDKGGVTIVANNVISPDGTQNADKVTEDSSNGNHLFYNITPPSTTTATASVFYKKGTRQFFSIKIQIGGNSYTQVFDADNLTATSNSSNGLTSVSNTITDFGNGWVRATLSGTNPAGAGDTYVIYSLSNSATPTFDSGNKNPTYQGSTSEYGYFWGAQLEVGSYATSYIPTTSASVTRNADSGTTNLGSAILNTSEGVLFLDYQPLNTLDSYPVDFQLQYNGDNVTNGVTIYQAGNVPSVTVRSGGSTIFSESLTATTTGTRNKIAIAYKQNDYAVYQNGVLIASQSSGVAPAALNQIRISDGLRHFSINAAALWKTRLTNTQLAQLTSI